MKLHEFESISKLHQLLEVGLANFQQAIESPDCEILMGSWLVIQEGRCKTCLAGATMRVLLPPAKLHRPAVRHITPWDFTMAADHRFWALNYLRRGDVRGAAAILDRGDIPPDHKLNRFCPLISFHASPWRWWLAMDAILKDLREADL